MRKGTKPRQLVLDLGMVPVVPPKSNRIEPWEYDRALYTRNATRSERSLPQTERLPPHLFDLRTSASSSSIFLYFALIVEALRLV